MQRTIDSSNYRRNKQHEYNLANDITPTAIIKPTREIIGLEYRAAKAPGARPYLPPETVDYAADPVLAYLKPEALEMAILKTKKEMEKAAKELDFIEAARLRDEMFAMQKLLKERKNG